MVHRSKILNWLKTKIDSFSNEDESEAVLLEAKLVRCVSEYRKLDIESIKLSKDFDIRLMNRLDHVNLDEVEAYDMAPRRSPIRIPLVLASAFSIALVAIFIITHEPDSEKSITNSSEDRLIRELKTHPEKVRMLEDLENYYSRNGKFDQASEIHTMIETVSKKY